MDHLYQQCSSLLSGVQQQVDQLVTGRGVGNEQALESKIADGLEQLQQDTYRLQTMVRKEPPSRKRESQIHVEQLMADYRAVENAFRNYKQRKAAAEVEAQQREELLSRRFTTNDDTKISIDPSLHHHQRLQEANKGMDSLLGNAAGVLGNLTEQRFTLKGAHRKLLDVANTLGLSNTVMRLIEKRTTQDWWLFWSGIAITSIIIVLVIYYFVL